MKTLLSTCPSNNDGTGLKMLLLCRPIHLYRSMDSEF